MVLRALSVAAEALGSVKQGTTFSDRESQGILVIVLWFWIDVIMHWAFNKLTIGEESESFAFDGFQCRFIEYFGAGFSKRDESFGTHFLDEIAPFGISHR